MTPDPNKSPLDREIAAALDGVDLQNVDQPSAAPGRKGGGRDQLYEGVVMNIHGDDVIVELGPRMEGVASVREFDDPPSVGDKFQFALRGREDGLWILSRSAAKDIASWDELAEGSHVKARVTGQNQGGLQLKIGKHDAFMPASQVTIERSDDLAAYIGQTVTAEVLEVDRDRDRVVLSRRRVLEGERLVAMQEAMGSITPGSTLTGKVTRIESFGAFVDIGKGVEGLLHVSNISRKRVEDVNEVLNKGQEVRVQVLKIEEGGKRIGLSMKHLEPDPWDGVAERYAEGREVTGKVTRLMDFGAFVEVEEGLEGLLHVSQLGRERVRNVGDVVKIGEEVTVRVVSVDTSARRIGLSRLDPRGAVLGSEEAVDSSDIDQVLAKPSEGGLSTNLGDLFKKALKDKS